MSPGGIALTFDDGPDPTWTPAVLDALAGADARATFFVIAPLAQRHPDLLARMDAEGHEVAVHCTAHVRHSEMSDDELTADLDEALATLVALDVRPSHWRAPWGVTRPFSHDLATRHDLRLVHWTADTEDWAGHAPDTMLDRVLPHLGDGGVVLAHDALGPGATRDGCANTVALVPRLVAHADELGLRCVPLRELVG